MPITLILKKRTCICLSYKPLFKSFPISGVVRTLLRLSCSCIMTFVFYRGNHRKALQQVLCPRQQMFLPLRQHLCTQGMEACDNQRLLSLNKTPSLLRNGRAKLAGWSFSTKEERGLNATCGKGMTAIMWNLISTRRKGRF